MIGTSYSNCQIPWRVAQNEACSTRLHPWKSSCSSISYRTYHGMWPQTYKDKRQEFIPQEVHCSDCIWSRSYDKQFHQLILYQWYGQSYHRPCISVLSHWKTFSLGFQPKSQQHKCYDRYFTETPWEFWALNSIPEFEIDRKSVV